LKLDIGDGIRLDAAGGDAKGGIEIQGYGHHARDLDVKRFNVKEPKRCRQ
jgi:hypothetical protein